MKRGLTGKYQTTIAGGEECKAFIPQPLPPEPPLNFNAELQDLYEKALLAVGGLSNLSGILPDTTLFIYNYVRKEALLSSQIEGTQSSLDELLLHESADTPGVVIDDVQEVVNYIRAMEHGIKRLKEDNFPLSVRLLREIHGELLAKGRGAQRGPGEFRRSPNWIGGDRPGNAVFVPAPHEDLPELMGDLEKFINDEPRKTPALIKAALAHVQFETIHPFLDGNGRIGRLLIALILFNDGVLTSPVLYLSLYFKTHRQEYYEGLQAVRMEGDWEQWLSFFLEGVKETSEQAIVTARRLTELFEEDREKIKSNLGRAAHSALSLHHELQKTPMLSIPKAVTLTGLSKPTVSSIMKKLLSLEIVKEVHSGPRKRFFSYPGFIRILSEGTEPIR